MQGIGGWEMPSLDPCLGLSDHEVLLPVEWPFGGKPHSHISILERSFTISMTRSGTE